jgi:hypothetical protein
MKQGIGGESRPIDRVTLQIILLFIEITNKIVCSKKKIVQFGITFLKVRVWPKFTTSQ